tara:strand:+ start:15547 stop:15690 length:144 start_codon:yes stop_codon:yes gene_type:complete
MGCPVGELQDRMTSREFGEWIARARIKAEEERKAEMIARVDQKMQRR